jgi:hypothetical protein
MTSREMLIEGRALIADRLQWTQGQYARTMDGSGVPARCDSAVSFCATGALLRADAPSRGYAPSVVYHEADDALTQAGRELFGVSAVAVNDDLGHAAVLRMYDRAIANETPGLRGRIARWFA